MWREQKKKERQEKRRAHYEKNREKIIEKVVEGRRKSREAKSGQLRYAPIKDAQRNVGANETSRSPRQKIEQNLRNRESWLENEVSDTVKKRKTKMHRFKRRKPDRLKFLVRRSQTGWPRNVPLDGLRRVCQIPRRRKQKLWQLYQKVHGRGKC